MKHIKYWLLIVGLSIKWMFRVNVMDLVVYNGKQYMVLNGVRADSWRLDLDNGDQGWVPRSECKKVWTLKNIIGSFKSGYRFYMGYWFDIWVRSGIKPWMKGCKIW